MMRRALIFLALAVATEAANTTNVTAAACTDAAGCASGCCMNGKCAPLADCTNIFKLIEANMIQFAIVPLVGLGITLLFFMYFLCCSGDDGMEGDNEWHDGHLSCFSNCGVCILTICCPCVQWASTAAKAKLGDKTHLMAMFAGLCIFPNIFAQLGRSLNLGMRDPLSIYFRIFQIVSTLCSLGLIYLIFEYRRKIVGRYRINEGNHCSFAWICCCPMLSIMQEARHVDEEKGLVDEDTGSE